MNIWAHRGRSYRYPENTLSSFAAACEYEITGIELDIQLSKDGELVVIHDEKVDRTTDGTGRVCDKAMTELKELHIAANDSSGLAYETIPTMREVLELLAPECRERGLLINIELKNSVLRYEGMEEKILALVREFALEPYIIYSSFNPDSIRLLKELNPQVKTGTLARELSKCLAIAEQIPVDALHPFVKQLDVKQLKEITMLPVRAWNIRQYEPFFPEQNEIEVQNTQDLERMGVTDIFTNAPELYTGRKSRDEKTVITLDRAMQINSSTGFAEKTAPDRCATYRFYKATAGSRIYWKNLTYEYQLFVYSQDTEERLIYTYCYQQEENWASFCLEKSLSDWQQAGMEYCFGEDCYFRICIRKRDNSDFGIVPVEEDILEYQCVPEKAYVWQNYFQEESRLTAESVQRLRTKDSFVCMILADSHYVVNGTWEDTAYNLRKTAEQVYPDAVIHLGDLTDGMTPAAVTKEYAARVMDDLKKIGKPVYLCLGNHDANYFKQNPEEMTEQECCAYYLGTEKPWYYVDVPEKEIRMFFLFSFDHHEQIRYGFPLEEVGWLRETLNTTPDGYKMLIFSHVPPLPEIHYWSDAIRNGEELMKVLEDYHNTHGKCVLAYVHGHNHAEQIYRKRAFPIISLGCNKLEDFKDKKPEGSYTYDRKRGTVTQDLWDIMVVDTKDGNMDFVRFGAGEDKHIAFYCSERG